MFLKSIIYLLDISNGVFFFIINYVMKIVVLGDSIRMGYAPEVEKYFKSKGYDFYQPQDNCRFIKYLLRVLFDDREIIKDADVIQFNAGHWDICQLYDDKLPFSSKEEFKENLIRVTKILLKITPKVIFATTTPVRLENPYNDNKVIDEYNQIAIDVMKEYGITINDLNSLLKKDIYRYICDDNIHLSEEGIEACKKQTIRYIEEALKK